MEETIIDPGRERDIKSNIVKYNVISVLHATATFLSSGALIQTFLLWLGISNTKVEFYSSYVLIFQCVTMLIFALVADKFKNIKLTIGVCRFIFPVIFVAIIAVLLCFTDKVDAAYWIILVGSAIANLALGIYNIVTYKLPYSIFHIESFGRISSVTGILGSVVGVMASFALSFFISVYDYRLVMTIAFSLGAILWLASAFINSTYKIIRFEAEEETADKKGGFKRFLTYPAFYKSIIPVILRGVGAGTIGLIVSIGTRDGLLTTQTSTYTTIVTSVATIAGYLVYIFIERHIKHRLIIIIAGILAGLIVPFITVGGNLIVFYGLYFFGYLLIIIISMAHPVLVYEAVPYDMIGRYTAFRMLFLTLGQTLPGFFIGALYEAVGSVGVLAVGGVCVLSSSVLLGLVLKKPKEKA